MYREYLILCERSFAPGVDNFVVAGAIRDIGIVLDLKGFVEETHDMFPESVNTLRRLVGVGQDNILLAKSLASLGIFLENQGQNNAEVQLKTAHEMYRRQRPEIKNADVMSVICALARVVREMESFMKRTCCIMNFSLCKVRCWTMGLRLILL